jgi:hypothetical protein
MSAFVDREVSLREMLLAPRYLGNYVSRNKKLSGSALSDEPESSFGPMSSLQFRFGVHCGGG